MVVLVVSDWAALMVFMLDGSYGAGQRDEKRGCFFEFLEREKMMKASIFFLCWLPLVKMWGNFFFVMFFERVYELREKHGKIVLAFCFWLPLLFMA